MSTRFCYYLDHRIKHTEKFPNLIGNCVKFRLFISFTRERTRANFFSVVRTRLQNCNPIKYSNRVCLDNDLRVLAAACKHKVPAVGVNLEEIIENHKRNAATYKTLEYTSHGMLKFSNCCCEQINARNVSCLGVE